MSIMCSYQNCLCVKYPCSSIAFFRLPSDSRRDTWIKNSGNKSLKNISLKAHRFFCENHFRQCDIRTQFNRKILRKHAVPIEHDNLRSSMLLTKNSEPSNKLRTSGDQRNKSNVNNDLIVEKLNIESNILQEFDSAVVQVQTIETNNSATEEDLDSSCTVMDFYVQESCEADEPYKESYIRETNEQSDLDDIFYENSNSHRPDSSSIDLQYITEKFDDEIPIDSPKTIEVPLQATTNHNNHIASSSNDYEEDRHFALSLVGYFQRLPKDRKAIAKLKILQYLTDLDIGLASNL